MNDARPFASLSSGLLARKGAARPAMRPQGFGPHHGFDDLGWNDMGQEPEGAFEEELPEHVPSSIAALTPAPKPAPQELPQEAPEPEVVAQQRAIAESFAAEEGPAPEPAPVPAEIPAAVVTLPRRPAPAKAPAAAPAPGGKKSAFTLRVDAERHLRLRLATAVTGRSAQQLVTEALDQLLASLPEIESLAERVPVSGGKRK